MVYFVLSLQGSKYTQGRKNSEIRETVLIWNRQNFQKLQIICNKVTKKKLPLKY